MINQARVTQTFLDYVQIDSETHFEREMTARLVADLEALGLPVTTDEAGKAGRFGRSQCLLPPGGGPQQ